MGGDRRGEIESSDAGGSLGGCGRPRGGGDRKVEACHAGRGFGRRRRSECRGRREIETSERRCWRSAEAWWCGCGCGGFGNRRAGRGRCRKVEASTGRRGTAEVELQRVVCALEADFAERAGVEARRSKRSAVGRPCLGSSEVGLFELRVGLGGKPKQGVVRTSIGGELWGRAGAALHRGAAPGACRHRNVGIQLISAIRAVRHSVRLGARPGADDTTVVLGIRAKSGSGWCQKRNRVNLPA